MTDKERQKVAQTLWQRLEKAFNDEAAYYEQPGFRSGLGSIGDLKNREVCRADWFSALGGWELLESVYENRDKKWQPSIRGERDDMDYDKITWFIEGEHGGDELETGRIRFGS